MIWLLTIPAAIVIALMVRLQYRLLRCTRRHLDNSTEVRSLVQEAPDRQRQ